MVCNWGVLGAGFIANRAMIPAIQQSSRARVLAVASRDEQRGHETAQRFSIERVYHDYRALLDDPDVQVVYIALPNHLHHEWTIRAARAGKHVLCEKPLALNAAECDDIISTCHSLKVLFMEAVMYRFHPRMQALKRMLVAGEVGELRFIHAAFSFPFDAPANYRGFPQFGGGALLDVGSYCVNAARWLSDSEPTAIHPVFSYSQNNIDLSASAILQFGPRLAAHIQCSFMAAEHQVIEIVGSEAAITAPLAFTAWRDDSTALLIQRGATFERREFVPADPYGLMVEHFTDCVLEQSTLMYPPEDGRNTLRVLDALRA
ncbi:MAG TPA: Gfo/Idh/MocA family oxidoreductase [Ktedonobacteraceae bacterium]|nr:Gfo/Idh/MocA family oxidoreductase [Ktedonobacteraceae bacterium]